MSKHLYSPDKYGETVKEFREIIDASIHNIKAITVQIEETMKDTKVSANASSAVERATSSLDTLRKLLEEKLSQVEELRSIGKKYGEEQGIDTSCI